MGWDDSDDEWDDDNLEKKVEEHKKEKEKAQRRAEGRESEDEDEEEKAKDAEDGGSWDDEDEWDADDLEAKMEAQRKEKERQRRRDQGLDSESEEEKKDSPKAKAAPKKKEKGPTQAKDAEKKSELDPAQVPLKDPKAERERLRKLEEDRDSRLATDLFSGFEKKETLLEKEKREKAEKAEAAKAKAKPKTVTVDEFEALQLQKSDDVNALLEKVLDKFETSTLAKGGPEKFIKGLIKGLDEVFDVKDLEDLEKTVGELAKQKKAETLGKAQVGRNKANTKINKNTKFNANSEWEDVYGGGEDDEDWTEEEWAAWYAKEGK